MIQAERRVKQLRQQLNMVHTNEQEVPPLWHGRHGMGGVGELGVPPLCVDHEIAGFGAGMELSMALERGAATLCSIWC